MRRPTQTTLALLVLSALVAFPVAAQQASSAEQAAAPRTSQTQTQQEETELVDVSQWILHLPQEPLQVPPAPPPEKVFIQQGARLPVILDTPLSTRITKDGESVTFLLRDPIRVDGGLEIPADTRIIGTVTEAKRPGAFGRAGKLKVKVTRMELPTGGEANITARLQSSDPSATQLPSDSSRAANLYSLATWTLQGTLLGSSIKGGKGAAVGAGAGAAAALIIMAAKRGPDLYLEPGMPFDVILDAPAEFRGWDVKAAQPQARYAGSGSSNMDSQASDSETSVDADPANDSELRSNRPQLKRRPKKNP